MWTVIKKPYPATLKNGRNRYHPQKGLEPMTLNTVEDTKQHRNSKLTHTATFTDLFVLNDGIGRTIGATTPEGEMLNKEHLLALRTLAHG